MNHKENEYTEKDALKDLLCDTFLYYSMLHKKAWCKCRQRIQVEDLENLYLWKQDFSFPLILFTLLSFFLSIIFFLTSFLLFFMIYFVWLLYSALLIPFHTMKTILFVHLSKFMSITKETVKGSTNRKEDTTKWEWISTRNRDRKNIEKNIKTWMNIMTMKWELMLMLFLVVDVNLFSLYK